MNRTRHLLVARSHPALLSIVIPIYNEQEALPYLRERLTACMAAFRCGCEVLLVNDGSHDGSLDVLVDWAEADRGIRVLNLARNFGHQAACTAGMDEAQGDAVVIIDADLQDPPEVIADMLAEYCRGYDVVYGQRASRAGETAFKRFTAWAFYRTMRRLIHPDLPADVGDFRLISRSCLDAVKSMRETHRFLRGMISWVGFPQTAVTYARSARVAGETKYPFSKMMRLAWTAAVSFSPKPLRVSFLLGLIVAAIGMLQAANAVIRSLLGLYVVPGWSSLIIVNCLVGGAILISIGVLGEYVGRIFEASKERPLYLIATRIEHRHAVVDPVPVQLATLARMGAEHDR